MVTSSIPSVHSSETCSTILLRVIIFKQKAAINGQKLFDSQLCVSQIIFSRFGAVVSPFRLDGFHTVIGNYIERRRSTIFFAWDHHNCRKRDELDTISTFIGRGTSLFSCVNYLCGQREWECDGLQWPESVDITNCRPRRELMLRERMDDEQETLSSNELIRQAFRNVAYVLVVTHR